MDHVYCNPNVILSYYAQNLDSVAKQDYLNKLRFVKPDNSVIIIDDPYIITEWKADMTIWPLVSSDDINKYLDQFPGKHTRAHDAYQLVVAGKKNIFVFIIISES